jgi:type I restriction enzyme, S subunit
MPKLSHNILKKTKHTPAGEIPVDWEWDMLGHVAKIKSGGTPSRKNSAFWNGNIPWVKTGEIENRWITSTSEMITDQGLAGCASDLFHAGTILMAMYGQGKTRGKVVRLAITAAINQACAAIIAKPTKVDSDFLYFNLESRYDEIRGLSNTGSQENLNAQVIRSLPIPLPPLTEQRRIANILSTWDRAIESLESLIAAKDKRKQALMQLLLTGRMRLPGFKGKLQQAKFRNFLKESRITGTHGATARKLTVRLYGRGISEKSETRKGSSNTRYYTRTAGQLIYSKLDFLNGAFAIVPEHLNGLESTLDLPSFDIEPIADARWLLSYLIRPEFYENCIGFAAGGRKARRVNPSEFLNIGINLPTLKEQQAIASILDTADRELILHRQHLATLRTQKRGLMQKLLKGEVRVKS